MAESIIKGRRKGFTMIYNSVLKDSRLDLKTKGFFAVMMSFPEEWEYTVKGLMQVMGVGKDAVQSCLRQLESAGYLMREQCREGGRFSKNVWVLLEESASPLAGFPSPEKPSAVLPSPVNPPQYKTIENKDNTNIPPISPTGEGEETQDFSEEKCLPKHKPERFERFWDAWPKGHKKARRSAVRAWDKLKASDKLLDRMAEALAQQMQSDQWKRGFVPYPATWLNGRRWEDEPDTSAPETAGGWADDPEVM